VVARKDKLVSESASVNTIYVLKRKLTMILQEIDVLQHIFHLVLSIFDKGVEYIVHGCCSHVDTNLYRLSDIGRQEK